MERICRSPGFQPIRKGLVFHPRDIVPSKPRKVPTDLRQIVFLTGRKADVPVRPLNPVETLRAVLPHSSAGRRGLRDGLKWLSAWADYWEAFSLGRQSLQQMVLSLNDVSKVARKSL